MAVGSVLVRLRLRGAVSHTEILFEPQDGEDVAALMPDGSLEPDEHGALWAYSSVGLERVPPWSPRRPGRIGGARFKRIVVDSKQWRVVDVGRDPAVAAQMASLRQGGLYDWQFIAGFLAWVIPHKRSRTACSEECALVLGLDDPHRFDPCALDAAVRSAPEWAAHKQ